VQVAKTPIDANKTRYVLTVKNMDTGNCEAEAFEAIPTYYDGWGIMEPVEPSNLFANLITQGQIIGVGGTTTITFEIYRHPNAIIGAALGTTPVRIFGKKYGFGVNMNLGL
jgi:hypothetical protein